MGPPQILLDMEMNLFNTSSHQQQKQTPKSSNTSIDNHPNNFFLSNNNNINPFNISPTTHHDLIIASSSSNINNNHHTSLDMQSNNTSTTSQSSDSGDPHGHRQNQNPSSGGTDGSNNKWASKLLTECARAISEKDSTRIHQLLWMLNELASPYGDCDQKLASYFLQALFCKATNSGLKCLKTLSSIAEKTHSFDTARKLILKFQEVSPWTTFGHVASNGAILEALDGETKLHIIDVSNTLCTQWPTLLESLATKNDETPRLKLTVVVTARLVRSVMKEIGQRMEKFARLMGVPFEFNVISGLNHLGELTKEALGVEEDEAIAINCIGSMRMVDVDQRRDVLRLFHSLNPKVVTIVEEEADVTSSRFDFVKCFEECLRYYTLYFDMLEESFAPTSNERLMLERECSRNIVRVLACDDHQEGINIGRPSSSSSTSSGSGTTLGECERRERGTQWSERLRGASFMSLSFSDDVVDDVRALLKRYKSGWSLIVNSPSRDNGDDHHDLLQFPGIYLTWKEEPVIWVSAWKP